MKTTLCPISDKRINENVARGISFLAVVLLIAFILTLNPIVIAFVFLDYLLRAMELSKYSVLSVISKKVNDTFKIQPKITNAGPKIFAARIGLLFSAAALVSTLAGWETTAVIFAGIFAFFAFLESVFAFCVACEIYPFVYKLLYKSEVVGS